MQFKGTWLCCFFTVVSWLFPVLFVLYFGSFEAFAYGYSKPSKNLRAPSSSVLCPSVPSSLQLLLAWRRVAYVGGEHIQSGPKSLKVIKTTSKQQPACEFTCFLIRLLYDKYVLLHTLIPRWSHHSSCFCCVSIDANCMRSKLLVTCLNWTDAYVYKHAQRLMLDTLTN